MASMRRARKPGFKELEPPPIPAHFRCPISLDLMRDPVTAPSGITYDRRSIEAWLDMGNATCPVTNRDVGSEPELIPNHSLRRVIQDWCVANRSVYGIERIPTPKIPVTAVQVTGILSEIAAVSGGARDESRASELAAKVKGSVGESDRNRRCFVRNGAGRALAEAFVLWSSARPGPLEGILSALISMSPLDEETLQVIAVGSPSALQSVVAILKSGGLAARLNAALLINQLLASSCQERAAEADGLVEAVFSLIKRPISAQATKAALLAAFRLATYDKSIAARFAELGLVPLLLEALVDADRSFCEKALAVLNAVLSSPRAKAESRDHALTVPVLLKKMFRVSDMATELVVSALYKLFKGSNIGEAQEAVAVAVVEEEEEEEEEEEKKRRECVIVEALQLGAFQKLLLLLQVGCSGETKERATWLLKMLNGHSGGVGCVDSMDFRGIKRPTQSFNK